MTTTSHRTPPDRCTRRSSAVCAKTLLVASARNASAMSSGLPEAGLSGNGAVMERRYYCPFGNALAQKTHGVQSARSHRGRIPPRHVELPLTDLGITGGRFQMRMRALSRRRWQ